MLEQVKCSIREATRYVDLREFCRFFLTGVTATVGNMMAVALARFALPYRFALIAGLCTGFVISFVMGKLFAFRSTGIRRAGAELFRFTLVYLFGAIAYWAVGMIIGLRLAPLVLPPRLAELVGVLSGASVMLVTSYLGHRWFTYAHLGRGA
jgi:putative flippase GtrA